MLRFEEGFFRKTFNEGIFDGSKTVYTVKEHYGEGECVLYDVADGIGLVYNDIHMYEPYKEQIEIEHENTIEINYMRQGRYACEFADHTVTYVNDGDFALWSGRGRAKSSDFSFKRHIGVTILVYVPKADAFIKKIFPGSAIDLYKLAERISVQKRCIVAKPDERIAHIFQELYTLPLEYTMEYVQVKVMELLLLMCMSDMEYRQKGKAYYSKTSVQKITLIKEFMEGMIDKQVTIEELARQYQMNATDLKTCFKDIYGFPIYSYMKNYRMQVASKLLRETDYKVIEIANKVGYANPSKFAAAFKSIFGVTPLKYKNAADI